MSSASLNMNVAIWAMAIYVFIYYFLARSVLARINRKDPDYFGITENGGDLPVGMKTSYTILEMVFDRDLPGREYGQFVRIGLYLVRVMFACYVPLTVLMLYMAWK